MRYNRGPKPFRNGKHAHDVVESVIASGTLELRRTRHRHQTSLTNYKHLEPYLHHRFFHELLLQGIESIPEFSDGQNRYDLLVLKNNEPVCIVEVKSAPRFVSMDQARRYEQNLWGVPLVMLVGPVMFESAFRDVLRLYNGA